MKRVKDQVTFLPTLTENKVTDDISILKAKLLEDATNVKICRNCDLCYIREDQEWGYCKLNRKDRPVEVPLSVHEYHTCDHWKDKNTNKEQ